MTSKFRYVFLFSIFLLYTTAPCSNEATCVNTIGRFECSCAPGTSGHLCQFTNQCQNSNTCPEGTNQYRSYHTVASWLSCRLVEKVQCTSFLLCPITIKHWHSIVLKTFFSLFFRHAVCEYSLGRRVYLSRASSSLLISCYLIHRNHRRWLPK